MQMPWKISIADNYKRINYSVCWWWWRSFRRKRLRRVCNIIHRPRTHVRTVLLCGEHLSRQHFSFIDARAYACSRTDSKAHEWDQVQYDLMQNKVIYIFISYRYNLCPMMMTMIVEFKWIDSILMYLCILNNSNLNDEYFNERKVLTYFVFFFSQIFFVCCATPPIVWVFNFKSNNKTIIKIEWYQSGESLSCSHRWTGAFDTCALDTATNERMINRL